MNIPKFLNDLLIKQYGDKITHDIIDGYNSKRKMTLRINTIKSSIDEVECELKKNNLEFRKVMWSKEAIILENASLDIIKNLDIYIDGKIYLQSLSSMIPAIILDPRDGNHILDMTAAPGSKTTQMSALSENKAFIMACEKNKIRCDRLKYNILKQGCKKVNVICEDSKKIDPYFNFDKILLDAPCSGSGTILMNDIDNKFSLKLVENSVILQTELLKKAISLLKSNQELVYSTCSILESENEDQIINILKDNSLELVNIDKNLFSDIPLLPTKIDGVICIKPTELYEGFFVAKIRKK